MKKTAPVAGAGKDRNQAATTEAICTPSLPQQVAIINGRSASMPVDQIRVDADPTERSVFLLRLEAKPGPAGIHQLRALLKALLRRHGLRCVDAREIRGRQR